MAEQSRPTLPNPQNSEPSPNQQKQEQYASNKRGATLQVDVVRIQSQRQSRSITSTYELTKT